MFNTKSKMQEPVTISPSFQLPIILIILSFMLLFLNIGYWPTIVFASFSFFLLLQSFTLRIKITDEDFVVLQLGKEIRTFPFKNWISWKFFFPIIPGIFYFREKSSPHLLPILFNPQQLKSELIKKVESLEIKNLEN
ncbi:conserved hypothetical protein [Prochlorococcus marinus str. MIT 9515]|uniref:DUF3119 domain-containing protein n=1 Tax=Prochlorococcus marinus (strain MIT 9515) TaxID=167542 RepID=A2BY32_PROM5|nr:DUF3119 family protein [Prochlorococcus marinus]ABM72693.1 conserved hypothetical protein [Prochlorococcus marinus str. MIT 9515]